MFLILFITQESTLLFNIINYLINNLFKILNNIMGKVKTKNTIYLYKLNMYILIHI